MNACISIVQAQCNIEDIYKIRTASLKKGDTFEQKGGRPGDCLIYIISGNAHYTTEWNEEFFLRPGSVLFLRNHLTYHLDVLSDDYAYIFVEFKFQSSETLLKNEMFYGENLHLEPLFRSMIETDVLKQPGYSVKCLSILYQIYVSLIEHTQSGSSVSFRYPQIERATYEIEKNFRNAGFRIYDVARKTGMSEVYFRKLFKEECGMSPSKYLISLRIAHAKNLITYENLSISEIAIASGFSDIYYFSRQFKKTTGLTPTEYKRYINAY